MKLFSWEIRLLMDILVLRQWHYIKQVKTSPKSLNSCESKIWKVGEYNDLKRSGRPKNLSDRDERHLKKLVQGENRLNVTKITTNLNISLPNPVTKRTVRNYLTKLGFEYKFKIKKQWLSKKTSRESNYLVSTTCSLDR